MACLCLQVHLLLERLYCQSKKYENECRDDKIIECPVCGAVKTFTFIFRLTGYLNGKNAVQEGCTTTALEKVACFNSRSLHLFLSTKDKLVLKYMCNESTASRAKPSQPQHICMAQKKRSPKCCIEQYAESYM